jgi:hypothetical protein
MAEKPHAVTLFLDSPLYVAFIEFQAENKLGRSFAGLLIFVEGLRKRELINELVYQHYKSRYMKPLRTLIEEENPLLAKQKQEELEKARKQLQQVIEQFPTLKPKTQQYWLKYALERPEIPESTELLRKFSEDEKT